MPVANIIKIFAFPCVRLTGEGGWEVERDVEREGRRWRGREVERAQGGEREREREGGKNLLYVLKMTLLYIIMMAS